MTTSERADVSLRQLRESDAEDVRHGHRPPEGSTPSWAEDFPQPGDLAGVAHAEFLPRTLAEPWHAPWLILEGDVVVGMLGFKGEPRGDTLEVGYSIVPSVRGRGVATTALTQLLDLIHGRMLSVIAETATWNVASQGVLERCNFHEVDRRHDPHNGDLIIWRRLLD